MRSNTHMPSSMHSTASKRTPTWPTCRALYSKNNANKTPFLKKNPVPPPGCNLFFKNRCNLIGSTRASLTPWVCLRVKASAPVRPTQTWNRKQPSLRRMLSILAMFRRVPSAGQHDLRLALCATFSSQSFMAEMKVFDRATKLKQRNRAALQSDYDDYEFIR